jgi:DNA invertase Pin-like site-specific DNA recombinase
MKLPDKQLPEATLFPALRSFFGYIRVSTNRQELSQESQEAGQRQAANFYGDGADLQAVFSDPDTSGRTVMFRDRSGAQSLIVAIKESLAQGNRPTVIFSRVDRLGRNAPDIWSAADFLKELGADLIFLDMRIDTSTPMGCAFFQMAAVFAQLQCGTIRENIQTALDRKFTNGELCGSEPYGWNAVPNGETRVNRFGKVTAIKHLVENPGQLEEIIHWHLQQAAGRNCSAIARDLNRRGVPTKRAGQTLNLRNPGSAGARLGEARVSPASIRVASGRWQAAQVAKILNSKTVRAWLAAREQN